MFVLGATTHARLTQALDYVLSHIAVSLGTVLNDLEMSGEMSMKITGHEFKRAKGPKRTGNDTPHRTLQPHTLRIVHRFVPGRPCEAELAKRRPPCQNIKSNGVLGVHAACVIVS